MPRIAWLTDIHLNFVRPPVVEALIASLADTDADAFLIGGDIGEAPDVTFYLNTLNDRLQRPIYFVLGNHDFYHGSIAGVRAAVAVRPHPRQRRCAGAAQSPRAHRGRGVRAPGDSGGAHDQLSEFPVAGGTKLAEALTCTFFPHWKPPAADSCCHRHPNHTGCNHDAQNNPPR